MVSDTNSMPRGLLCPIVTPLKTGGVLDTAVLDSLIQHVGRGADALVVGDVVWGEGLALGVDTRVELVCAALEVIQGKWPVLISISDETDKATRNLMARIESFIDHSEYAGRVFWLDYPIYYSSNRGLPQLYESMVSDTCISFALGNNSDLAASHKGAFRHTNIRTSILKRLSQIERVQGLVFHGDSARESNYRKAVRGCHGFRFYDGNEMRFLRQPSSDGVVAGGANLLPVQWRSVVESCLNRYDTDQPCPDHAKQIVETGAMLKTFSSLYAKNSAAVIKQMLHMSGVLPNAQCASATHPSTDRQNREIKAICDRYGLAKL